MVASSLLKFTPPEVRTGHPALRYSSKRYTSNALGATPFAVCMYYGQVFLREPGAALQHPLVRPAPGTLWKTWSGQSARAGPKPLRRSRLMRSRLVEALVGGEVRFPKDSGESLRLHALFVSPRPGGNPASEASGPDCVSGCTQSVEPISKNTTSDNYQRCNSCRNRVGVAEAVGGSSRGERDRYEVHTSM